MACELTWQMSIGVHYVAGRRTPKHSTHRKKQFQTQNGPLISDWLAEGLSEQTQPTTC